MRKLSLTKPLLDHREADAVKRVLDSGWLAEGSETERFEKRIAEYVGAKHAVAVANCTLALELCLKACGMKQREIIVPSLTHMATIQAVLNVECIPVLCDVDLNSRNMDGSWEYHAPSIPVSWGGHPVEDYHNALVEDAACALGTHVVFPLACFSFHPRKLITTGEGGVITCQTSDFAQRVRAFKNFGVGGGNYKFDDIRASIGLAQMDKLESIIECRITMAHVYDDLLRGCPAITTPTKPEGARHTYQTYAVLLNRGNRDEIILKLRELNIEVQIGTYALHTLPQYSDYHRIGDLKNAELLGMNLLALPMAYDITEEEQHYVVDCLKTTIS